MLKNKPKLPTTIKDYEGYEQELSIEFYNELAYIQYGAWYYDEYTPFTIGGNPIRTSSKYIENAWDEMLDMLKTYGLEEVE